MMHLLLAAMLATATPASAAPWETLELQTEEGAKLVTEKKGRMHIRMQVAAPEKSESIKCPSFHEVQRPRLAMMLQTAGERAKTDSQVGPILDFHKQRSAWADRDHADLTMAMCMLGVEAYPGKVVLTLGNVGKMQGRLATISAEDAVRLAAWLR